MCMLIHGNPCFLLLIETAAPPLFHTVRGNHPYGGEMHQKIHTNSSGHALNGCSCCLRFCWKQTTSRSFAFCCHHSVTMLCFQGDQYQWWTCIWLVSGLTSTPASAMKPHSFQWSCLTGHFFWMASRFLLCFLGKVIDFDNSSENYIMDYINLPLQMNVTPNLNEWVNTMEEAAFHEAML